MDSVKTRITTHRKDLVCGKCYEILEMKVIMRQYSCIVS